MIISFNKKAIEDFYYWIENDIKTYKKIKILLQDIQRNKYEGLGHPKPLKGDKSGWWRRNIDEKNRIVYRITDDNILEISQCKGHYDDK